MKNMGNNVQCDIQCTQILAGSTSNFTLQPHANFNIFQTTNDIRLTIEYQMEVRSVWKRKVTVDGQPMEQPNEDNIAVYKFLLVTTEYCGIFANSCVKIVIR